MDRYSCRDSPPPKTRDHPLGLWATNTVTFTSTVCDKSNEFADWKPHGKGLSSQTSRTAKGVWCFCILALWYLPVDDSVRYWKTPRCSVRKKASEALGDAMRSKGKRAHWHLERIAGVRG